MSTPIRKTVVSVIGGLSVLYAIAVAAAATPLPPPAQRCPFVGSAIPTGPAMHPNCGINCHSSRPAR